MKIYTKTGDKGETSLIGGVRVVKYHPRIEAYGTIDELNSYLGYVQLSVAEEKDQKLIREIQDRLFTIGSLLASAPGSKMILPDLKQTDIEALESRMDELDAQLPELKNFVLPGGSKDAAMAHVARCVCRRAERLIIEVSEKETVDALVIPYINRLSDYLFVVARKLVLEAEAEEIPWRPRNA
ncbi:MAG: cob(I)yrinic acid a,c-diamide adenosyltransferase [Bacteroidetes bacterium]|nr:cob(I)yrinic acid a,c-diamide adenosyltransferase [Bacteroidota bacterium]